MMLGNRMVSSLAVPCAVGMCFAYVVPCHAQPLSLNLVDAYQPFRTVAASGTQVASILCLGDSLTFREGGFCDNFKPQIQALYGNAGWGYQGMSIWTGVVDLYDGWDRGRINADSMPNRSLDGLWLSSYSWARAYAAFAPIDRSFRLHFAIQPGGGTLTVALPNESVTTFECESTSTQLGVFEHTLSEGEEALVRCFSHADGTATILGCENLTGTPGVVVHRAANGGWGVDEFVRRDWTFDAQVAQLQPQLVIIMLGQNDADKNYDTFFAMTNQVVDRVLASVPLAKIVLISSYDSGSPHLIPTSDAFRAIAQQRGLGFIDLYRAGGRYQYFLNNLLLDPDNLHYSDPGGAYVANLILTALETGGESLLNAPCSDIDFNNDGSQFDPQDAEDFLSVYGEGPCSTSECDSLDFNRDGSIFDPQDIDDFLRVYSEGPCRLP